MLLAALPLPSARRPASRLPCADSKHHCVQQEADLVESAQSAVISAKAMFNAAESALLVEEIERDHASSTARTRS